MDMNAVRLCFQCELEWDDGRKDCLSPVVSSPIYDKSEGKRPAKPANLSPSALHCCCLLFCSSEATTTSQLKISQLNQYKGSCAGKTEIYMLCDKVQKGNASAFASSRFYWRCPGD